MHGTRTRNSIAGMLSLAVIILSLTFGAIVGAHTMDRSFVAATGTASTITTNTGGSTPWGFILGIGAAVAIFVIGGLFIALRARRDYLDAQARQATKPRGDD